MELTAPVALEKDPADDRAAARRRPPRSSFPDPEALRALSVDQLDRAFRAGPEPTSVAGLSGDPNGLGLGLEPLAGGRLDRWLRARAVEPDFPWRGKSFRIRNATEGWGFNRVAIAGLLGALRFEVSIAPSHYDGRPAITLDYRDAANPRWSRPMVDELREIMPGLYLGPACIRTRGRLRRLAWFAVDTSRQLTQLEI